MFKKKLCTLKMLSIGIIILFFIVSCTDKVKDVAVIRDSIKNTPIEFQNMVASYKEYRVAIVDGGDLWNWVANVETDYDNAAFSKKIDEKSVSTKPQKIEGLSDVVSVSLDYLYYRGIAVKADGTVWTWDFYTNNTYTISNIKKINDISDAKYALILNYDTIPIGGSYCLYGLCIVTHNGEFLYIPYSYGGYDDNFNITEIIPKISVQKIPKNEKIKYISGCNKAERFAVVVLESGNIGVLNYNDLSKTLEFNIVKNCDNVFYVQNPIIFFNSGDIGYIGGEWDNKNYLHTVKPADNRSGIKFFGDYGFINIQGDIFDYNLKHEYTNISDAIFFKDVLIITATGEVYELVDGQKTFEEFGINHYRYLLNNAKAVKVNIPNVYVKHLIDNLPRKVAISVDAKYDPTDHFAEIYSQ